MTEQELAELERLAYARIPTGPPPWCFGPAAVLALIAEVRRLRPALVECVDALRFIRGLVDGLAARVAGQSELLSKRAEKAEGAD